MVKTGTIGTLGGASLIAMALVLSPALADSPRAKPKAQPAPVPVSGIVNSFTPAVADSRLAAEFARRGFQLSSFRFTPSSASLDQSKAVRVAVRARMLDPADAVRTAGAFTANTMAITPSAYDLGVAVGWRRFALSGDVSRLRDNVVPGNNESAEVRVTYAGKKFAGRIQVAAERAKGVQSLIAADEGYSLDVGGSYSIARHVALTGGVRYKIQRDRLEALSDQRRDSQAVYIGTAFRF